MPDVLNGLIHGGVELVVRHALFLHMGIDLGESLIHTAGGGLAGGAIGHLLRREHHENNPLLFLESLAEQTLQPLPLRLSDILHLERYILLHTHTVRLVAMAGKARGRVLQQGTAQRLENSDEVSRADLTPEVARQLADIRPDADTQARIEEFAEKCNER